eukprot:5361710-Prymnesium_polylepis.1
MEAVLDDIMERIQQQSRQTRDSARRSGRSSAKKPKTPTERRASGGCKPARKNSETKPQGESILAKATRKCSATRQIGGPVLGQPTVESNAELTT